jgi:hypothetical protein
MTERPKLPDLTDPDLHPPQPRAIERVIETQTEIDDRKLYAKRR